jgi:hypothetical protein
MVVVASGQLSAINFDHIVIVLVPWHRKIPPGPLFSKGGKLVGKAKSPLKKGDLGGFGFPRSQTGSEAEMLTADS